MLRTLSKRQKTARFSVLSAAFQDMEIFQTLGHQLGTLVPRPQNPWAVRGEQFLVYPLGAAWPLRRFKILGGRG